MVLYKALAPRKTLEKSKTDPPGKDPIWPQMELYQPMQGPFEGHMVLYIKGLGPSKNLGKIKNKASPDPFSTLKTRFFRFLVVSATFPPKNALQTHPPKKPFLRGGDGSPPQQKITKNKQFFTGFYKISMPMFVHVCVCAYVCMQGPLLLQNPQKNLQKTRHTYKSGAFTRVLLIFVFS